jgi:hypothetical protein
MQSSTKKYVDDGLLLKENTANKKTSINDSDTEFPTSKAVKTALNDRVSTSNIANNLTTTAEGSVLDARQGPVITTALDTKADAASITGKGRSLAEQINDLNARITSIEALLKSNLGDVTVNTINIIRGVNQYGSDGNAELKASGAPAAIPDYIGQQYTDTSNGNLYKAKNNTAVNDWVKIN